MRDAENPLYEVVLTEGRNRQIRKVFEEIGHHVEKIRRVGYGTLVLDVPPGEVRELEPREVAALERAGRPRRRRGCCARWRSGTCLPRGLDGARHRRMRNESTRRRNARVPAARAAE